MIWNHRLAFPSALNRFSEEVRVYIEVCVWNHFHIQGSHRSGNSGKILKTFSSQGNQGKTGFFQPNSGKKFQIRELFFQTIFKPFKPINLRKMF